MSKIVNVQYTILDDSLTEIPHHFETNSGMVKLLNKSQDVVGTVDELMFSGKVISGGSFKDLKVSGKYKIKGVKNLPSNISVDKTCILSIDALGEIGNPTIIKYELTTPDGDIRSCVYADGRYTEWSSGGISVREDIDDIKDYVGNNGELSTETKDTIVGAINELSRKLFKTQQAGTQTNKELEGFSNHNHDKVYVKQTGGEITGTLLIGRGGDVKYINTYGRELNALKSDYGKLTVGNSSDELSLESNSSSLTFNGKEILTSGNIKQIIKDKEVTGFSPDDFIKKGSDMKISGGSDVSIAESYGGTAGEIVWKSSGGTRRGGISIDSSGRFLLDSGNRSVVIIGSDGTYNTKGKVICNASEREGGLVMRLDSTDAGMGIYRNNSSKYMGFYNWSKQKRLGFFSDVDDALHLDEALVIKDRRLHLSSGAPSGNHRVGDIWIG